MSKSKKSRRRFLADMLFLGGGISAAALLGQSLRDEKGAVTSPKTTPEPKTSPRCKKPVSVATPEEKVLVTKGESIPPSHQEPEYRPGSSADGDFDIGYPTYDENGPLIEGRSVMPNHQ